MTLEIGRGEGPRGFGRPPIDSWVGRGNSRRPSVEKALELAGVNLGNLLELSRKHPEIITTLRKQLDRLLNEGATQQDIVDFFRKQSEGSGIIADLAEGSGKDWKDGLKKIRDRLPKTH